MLNLNNATICCIDTKNKINALTAFDKSIKNISFEKYLFFTNDIEGIKINEFKNLSSINFEIINIPTINSKSEYSKFCLVDLNKYISTDFCLTIQHDGYIINSDQWKDEFLNFDYIGAPWPPEWGYKNRVGNGGFCLKSKKFLDTCEKIFSNFGFRLDILRDKYDISVNEDFLSCNVYYDEFLKAGIKYADVETASYFSMEHPIPEIKQKTFGFHDKFLEQSKVWRLKYNEKIESFAHSEFNNEHVKNKIKENLNNNKDLLGRDGYIIEKTKIDDSYPVEVINNVEKYKEIM